MYKILFLIVGLQIFNCEKPLPQQPKVISTYSYQDTIPDSIKPNNAMPIVSSSESIRLDDTKEVVADNLDNNYTTYTNAAGRIVHVQYQSGKDPRQIKLNFPEKDIVETLTETSSNSNTYRKNNIIWETVNNHRTGKLTVFGTWFEFIIKD